jgi:glycosyltransferase involved in cell wall biosynthesis
VSRVAQDTRGRRTLYLCYFGIDEPLVRTQVLPYLGELSRAGYEPTLLTFEPNPSREWRRSVAPLWIDRLRALGVRWDWLRYHKRPSLPATAFDILRGAWRARAIIGRQQVRLVHARSHAAALMGRLATGGTGARLIFDIRGLLAEEYVEGGVWPADGLLYRTTKRMERWLIRQSDGVVVLTDAVHRAELSAAHAGHTPVAVIPCCVDLARFRCPTAAEKTEARDRLGLSGRRVVAHLGVLDGWVATRETAMTIAAACRADPSTAALIVTRSPVGALMRGLADHGVLSDRVFVHAVDPEHVPAYLRAADVGLALYKTGRAKIGTSPTKIAEYLASGVVVLGTRGVGDVEEILVPDRVGVVLEGDDWTAIERAWRGVEALLADAGTAARCCRAARARFDLVGVGGARYRQLYARVLDGGHA